MHKSESGEEVIKWSEMILCQDNELYQDISSNWPKYRVIFIEQIAEYFYKDLQRTQLLFTSSFTFSKEFGRLSEEEKSHWYDFASGIPGKFKSLNLFIRPYKDFCRTCLIPFKALEILARTDYEIFCLRQKSEKPAPIPFYDLPEKERRFYIELNHLIPLELKKTGYEIVRPEEISEINENMVRKIARTIHSRYRNEIKKQDTGSEKKSYISWIHNPGDSKNMQIVDFNDLPEDIRHSNLDNAFHIPTKLLAIGYKIRPVGKGFKPATLNLSEDEVETMARIEHLRWCWDKTLHGWFYGKVKDSRKKIHPSIISYEDLSEAEKDKGPGACQVNTCPA